MKIFKKENNSPNASCMLYAMKIVHTHYKSSCTSRWTERVEESTKIPTASNTKMNNTKIDKFS